MSRTQSHSTAGSIMSVNIYSDVICNPSRNLPPYSAVSQPSRETEGHLITVDVHSCTHMTSVIISLYFRAEQVTLTYFRIF